MPKIIIKDFPTSESNQRNSEGAFCRLSDGRLAFVYSSFRNGGRDENASDLSVSFSSDEGRSFSDGRVILKCGDADGTNLMSVSLLPSDNGEIMLFYLKKEGARICRMFMRKTADFESFSEETQCIEEDGYFVVNNDRVIRLASGRIIIPAAHVPVDSDGHYGFQTAEFYASDDGGLTFRLLSKVEMPCPIFTTGMQEPGLLEYEAGRTVMYARNNSGRQFIAYSDDSCETWTEAEPSRFTSPCSPLCTKKLRDGRVIAAYNPVPEYYGRKVSFGGIWTGGRTPLILSVCRSHLNDEYRVLTLEDDEEKGFCYTAIYELGDRILLGYCAGGAEDGGMLNRLRIVSLDKSDLA